MRRFVLSVLFVLLVASAGIAQPDPLMGEPLAWEVVGLPVDDFDLWPDAKDIFLTDSVAYLNGGDGLFRIYPGDSDFRDEPWVLLNRNILSSGIYATSTGALFAISDGISRSIDGGATWEGVFDDSRGLAELPSGTLVASENAFFGIGRSTDGGATWTTIDLHNAIVPRGIGFAPPSPQRPETAVVALGRDGAVYSTDDGVTWTPSNLASEFAYFGEDVNYSAYHDSLFAGINGDPGPDAEPGTPTTGLVWASADGAVWEYRGQIPTGGDESPVQVVAGSDGMLWALVPGRIDPPIYSSEDGGRTWVERGVIEGEPVVGNDMRIRQLRMGPDGRLWVAGGKGSGPNTDTGAVLRTVAPVTVAVEPGAEAEPGKPGVELGAAYPNPSGGVVSVAVRLRRAAAVRVVVYDGLGRAVRVLHDGVVGAGERQFRFETGGLPAGAYVVRAIGDGFVASRQVTLVD